MVLLTFAALGALRRLPRPAPRPSRHPLTVPPILSLTASNPKRHNLVTVEGTPGALTPRGQVTTRNQLRDRLPVHPSLLPRWPCPWP